jgi:hypothetical protein
MAQAKTRTKAKRASGRAKSSGSTSNRGSTKKTANRSKGSAANRSKGSGRAKPGSTRSRAPSKSKSRTKKGNSGGSRPKTQTGSGASSSRVLEKAKGPATMAGAALIGVAGGIAAVRGGGKRRSGLISGAGRSGLMAGVGKALSKPNLNGLSTRGLDLKGRLDGLNLPKSDGSTIGWIEEKAREFGDAGYRVADLTSEARRLQKGGSGRG